MIFQHLRSQNGDQIFTKNWSEMLLNGNKKKLSPVIQASKSLFLFFRFFSKNKCIISYQGCPSGATMTVSFRLVWLISNWPFHETACRIFPAFARLAAHFWQIEVLSGARRGQEKLTPISVALTDQVIGLFISALCVVHVTMHRLTKAQHGSFDRCVDRLPGCPVSPYVSGRGSETDIVFSSVRMLSFILHALQGAGLPVELPTFRSMRQVIPVVMVTQ